MPRVSPLSADSPRHDFLLHTAAAFIGVLVILALVASAGVGRTTIPKINYADAENELKNVRATAGAVEIEIKQLENQTKYVDMELGMRKQEREILATLLVAGEKQIADQLGTLDKQSQADYDLARDLALAKAELERLERERLQVDKTVPKSLKIESYPTPISKPVDSKELHVQLRGGRVTVLPVEELVERLKRSAKERVWKLRDSAEMTDTVGPVDGFRMRYTLVRVDAGGGGLVKLDHWELVPVASDLGEPWEDALSETSQLRAKLDQTHPRTWTVTLWVYPDSFDAFRALRKEFYQLGYTVAGRPLPEDVPIGGSPRGTRSAAQ